MLHLPSSRPAGADLFKLQRQIVRFGSSTAGMPVPWVHQMPDVGLMLFNGVSRATRVAMFLPGVTIRVEVIGQMPMPSKRLPTIGELLP